MSFVNVFSASLDGNWQHFFKEWTAKSKEQTGLIFLLALTNLGKMILEKKVPDDLRLYFGAESIAQDVPDRGLRTIAIKNTLRRLSEKCAVYHVFKQRQTNYGSSQVDVGFKRGAKLALRGFRTLV